MSKHITGSAARAGGENTNLAELHRLPLQLIQVKILLITLEFGIINASLCARTSSSKNVQRSAGFRQRKIMVNL